MKKWWAVPTLQELGTLLKCLHTLVPDAKAASVKRFAREAVNGYHKCNPAQEPVTAYRHREKYFDSAQVRNLG